VGGAKIRILKSGERRVVVEGRLVIQEGRKGYLFELVVRVLTLSKHGGLR